MLRILALVSVLIGAGCTTQQPVALPYPDAPAALLEPCDRPQPMQTAQATTARAALETVTANYARHHACADRLDALQEWSKGQAGVTPP